MEEAAIDKYAFFHRKHRTEAHEVLLLFPGANLDWLAFSPECSGKNMGHSSKNMVAGRS